MRVCIGTFIVRTGCALWKPEPQNDCEAEHTSGRRVVLKARIEKAVLTVQPSRGYWSAPGKSKILMDFPKWDVSHGKPSPCTALAYAIIRLHNLMLQGPCRELYYYVLRAPARHDGAGSRDASMRPGTLPPPLPTFLSLGHRLPGVLLWSPFQPPRPP